MSEVSDERRAGAFEGQSPDLEALMRRYQQADRAAAEQLMEALQPILMRFFLSTPEGRQSADDLVQETLLRLHRARHTYRPPDPLLPWVFAIARHARVDQYRKRRRTTLREEAMEPEKLERQPAPASETPDQSPDFESLMAQLPDSQREVLTMLKVLGMSVDEVAGVTGSTAGSVKQKAHRAYNRLRLILRPTIVNPKRGMPG
jgi:RNA polymerase sigma-70 factor (ECF subfamily)